MAGLDYDALGLKELLVHLDGAVAVITLNRAKQRNTWSRQLAAELVQVFDLVDRDDRVRVVVFTAEPTAPAFCSGADLSDGWAGLESPDERSEGFQATRDTGGIATIAILRCRKITIVAVNGHAVGIGVTGLQLPFDFRFIWAGAKIALPFVRRGVVPEAASTYLLPKLLGHARASALLLSGSTLFPTAPEIQGLYHRVLPTREEVFPAALLFAQELAANTSQTSVAMTKALLWHGYDSVEEQHLLDSKALRFMVNGRDSAEGANAFKERRPLRFLDTLSEHLPDWMPWWREVDTKHRKAKL